jgi:AcrR family transcriptional regulator
MASQDAPLAGKRRSAADKLCDVAGDLFYKRGIRAVGVEEIVTETGVTKPTLYRNYASKDDLVSACLLKSVEQTQAGLDAIETRFADDPAGALRAIIAFFADVVAEPDYRGCALMNAAVEFPEPGHPVRDVSERFKAGLRGRLAGHTRRLDTRDPDALADGLTLLIEGASTSRHTSGSQGPSAALAKAAEALIGAYLTR